jgi:NAD-dependent dihydropyrimidine dehydrogenase PreA subunit
LLDRFSSISYNGRNALGNPIEGGFMFRVVVDPEKCVGDEECIEVCPVDVYELQDGKSVPVRADECIGCESCVQVCDFDAITITDL